MKPELVSVIMPTYNAGKFLADSIESILSQTYANLELLITDDCSTDGTIDILKDFAQRDKRVKVKYLKSNVGPAIARNRSIERAKGRYIAFCDCDDRWMPEKLERQIALMTRKDCALCSSSYLICDDNNQLTGINISPKHLTLGMLKRDNKIGCLTAIYDIKRLGHKFYMPAIRKRSQSLWPTTAIARIRCRATSCRSSSTMSTSMKRYSATHAYVRTSISSLYSCRPTLSRY